MKFFLKNTPTNIPNSSSKWRRLFTLPLLDWKTN